MKWQGRTGLLVGLALVVAAGLVVPGKNREAAENAEPPEEPVAAAKKNDMSGAVPVSRQARDHAPGINP